MSSLFTLIPYFATVLQTFIAAYISFIIGFVFYFLLVYNRRRVEGALTKRFGSKKSNIYYVGLEKLTGFTCMMVLPMLVLLALGLFDTTALGVDFVRPSGVFIWGGGLAACALVVNIIRAGKPANYSLYPQIRSGEWTTSLLGYYIFGWALYLLGYEFLFRGILFFSGINILPLWLNILINCVLYALAHLPKGRLEIIASLPFGIILCLLSWHTGSFWAAWGVHLALALSNSLIALRANPGMKLNMRQF